MKMVHFAQAQVRNNMLNPQNMCMQCTIADYSSDLKSMLDSNGRREEAGGNPLHTDINAIAPMG
jgi:hypothetical protein